MTLFRLLFGLLVLLKAIHLLRLWETSPLLLGGLLGGVWVLSGLGLFTRFWRPASIVLAADAAAILVVVPALYNNHLVLIGLVALFMGALDEEYAQAALRWQVSVVYLFTALAKLTPWYLRGDILAANTRFPWPDLLPAVAAASVGAELFLAAGLWVARTRPLAILVGVGLHLSILLTMPTSPLGIVTLTVFGGLMVALYIHFLALDPDLDRRLDRLGRRALDRLPLAARSARSVV